MTTPTAQLAAPITTARTNPERCDWCDMSTTPLDQCGTMTVSLKSRGEWTVVDTHRGHMTCLRIMQSRLTRKP